MAGKLGPARKGKLEAAGVRAKMMVEGEGGCLSVATGADISLHDFRELFIQVQVFLLDHHHHKEYRISHSLVPSGLLAHSDFTASFTDDFSWLKCFPSQEPLLKVSLNHLSCRMNHLFMVVHLASMPTETRDPLTALIPPLDDSNLSNNEWCYCFQKPKGEGRFPQPDGV
ncbi:hypothetical protein PAMP_023697 [Pampus punctatissimus]